LQSAYCAVVRMENLDQVENLRAYFCRVPTHEVHREAVSSARLWPARSSLGPIHNAVWHLGDDCRRSSD
jgi:hypothetical protein